MPCAPLSLLQQSGCFIRNGLSGRATLPGHSLTRQRLLFNTPFLFPSAARTAETPGFILLRKLRKNKEGRIQASCWNAGVAVPPFTRTPICPGREKLSAGAPLARKNGKKNLPVNKPGPLPPERNAGRKGLSSTEEKSNGLFWKPSRNSSCAGLRGWWGARW